jgi:hypothetical protein
MRTRDDHETSLLEADSLAKLEEKGNLVKQMGEGRSQERVR